MEGIRLGLLALGLITFQLILSPVLSVENLAYPAPYLLFWIVAPFSWIGWRGGLLAVSYGFALDVLFPPHGLQTFCGLWVWSLRKGIYRLLYPNLPPEWETYASPRDLGSGGFFVYAFPLTLVHHLLYFPLAAWDFSTGAFLRVGLSAAYSFLWEWIIFELFLRRRHVRA